QTITATDTAHPEISGTSNAILVNPGPLHELILEVPDVPVTAGTPFSFTIDALDSFGNKVTSYMGPVAITSSDHLFQLVQLPPFSGGTKPAQARRTTAGFQQLTATNPTAFISRTSPLTKAPPGPPDSTQIDSDNNTTGPVNTQSPPLVVIVKDKFGNPIAGPE